MKTELKKISPFVFKLFINGKAAGNEYVSNDSEEFLNFNFNDKLLDIPCTALPANTSLEFHFAKATLPGWVSIITLTRRKKELIIDYFVSVTDYKQNYYNNLNEYVLMRKIADAAKKMGMKPDYIPEEDPCAGFYLITNTAGTLRQKITTGITILINARKKAEQEMVTAISKGILSSKLSNIPFKGYLKLGD